MPLDARRVFAAHDWGEGGANHRRVADVVARLQSRGVTVWFDENDMKGNILSAMCRGIDTSSVVLVFVTRAYMDKVEFGDEVDNVRREFMYAARTPEKLLPVRFDPDLPKKWSGPVGMVLGSHLYCDLAGDITDAKVDDLVKRIAAHTPAVDATPVSGVTKSPSRSSHVLWREVAARTSGRCLAPIPAATQTRTSSTREEGGEAALQVVGTSYLTIKKRVQRLVDIYGSVDPSSMHTREIVDRLYDSVVGSAMKDMGILEKIWCIEQQLVPSHLNAP